MVRPVLSSLSPSSGPAETMVTLIGEGFAPGADVVLGNSAVRATTFISSANLSTKLPGFSPGALSVAVEVNGQSSDTLTFQVTPDRTGEFIYINYVRAQITLDTVTIDRLRRLVAAVATSSKPIVVVVAARRIVLLSGDVIRPELSGSNLPWTLKLVCETLEANGATLDAAGAAGDAATELVGRPGRSIDVAAIDILGGLTITTDGGAGANGRNGREGIAPREPEFDPERPGRPTVPGRPGRPATAGTDGSDGGAAGLASVRYVSADDEPQLSTRGGAGGTGGIGGTTIDNIEGEEIFVEKAPNGSNGARGADATATRSVVALDDWWSQVVSAWVPTTRADVQRVWRAHAEWRYRRLGGAPVSANFDDTRSFFRLAERAGDTTAEARRRELEQGLLAIGQSRFSDVGADVEFFANRFALVSPGVSDARAATRDLLLAGSIGGLSVQILQSRLADLDRGIADLSADVVTAQERFDNRMKVAARAESNFASAQKSLEDKRQELANKQIDIGGIAVVGVLGLFAFIAGFLTAGTGAAVVVSIASAILPGVIGLIDPSLKDEAEFIGKALKLGGSKDLTKAAKGVADLSTVLSEVSIADAQARLAEELKKAGGELTVNFGELIEKLRKSTGDAEAKALLTELAERGYDLVIANAEQRIAEVELGAARDKQSRAVLLRADVVQVLQRAIGGAATLRDAVFTLLALSRTLGDAAATYQFRAARALEIYALSDRSAEMRSDVGFVDPDIEEDYRQDLVSATEFLAALTPASVSTGIAQLILAFDEYESQLLNQQVIMQEVALSASEIEILKSAGRVTVALLIDTLPRGFSDVKVIGVEVYLQGVTYTGPLLLQSLPVFVSHLGRSAQLATDGSTVEQILPARTVTPNASRPPMPSSALEVWSAKSSAPEARFGRAGFFGRGAAASYELAIRASDLIDREISLANLTAVTFVVVTAGLLREIGTTSSPLSIRAALLEFDPRISILRRQIDSALIARLL
ncbi:MAG: IPT/TIG domain-containing protein [Anaerolineae bacterium]|nr:IPT/TIG domain-containing protein [Gloeobacterales cyanobacterium ES-bin-313]